MKLNFLKFFLFLSFIFVFSIKAEEPIKVQITEIFPFTLDDKKEWFEFSVSGKEVVDISEWSVSNGKSEKKIKDIMDNLLWNENVEKIENNEEKILFKINKNALFSWKISPVSLSDSGGEIKILNSKNAIVSQAKYPHLKKGSKNKKSWAEIWTFDEDINKFFPFIYFPEINSKQHSKLKKNKKSPAFSQNVEILISEFAPKRNKGLDFIEIFIKKGSGEINLKYAELKVNGSTLWRFEEDFLVTSGDFLVFKVGSEENKIIQKKSTPYLFETSKISSLSTGSTSIEFNLFSETSLEKNEDFVCFKKENLSQSEKTRVDKNIQEKNWSGACIEIQNIIDNQSFARILKNTDNNNYQDFTSHFNGSLGQENETQNNLPNAIIKIQGNGKSIGNPPFSLNLTGEFSTDPDGKKDLKKFIWSLNGKNFSEKENPLSFKIEDVGEYKIELLVEDFSGGESVAFINIFVQNKLNSGSSDSTQTTKVIDALLQDSLNFKKLSTKSIEENDNRLFAEVLQNKKFIEEIIQNSAQIKTPNYNLKKKKLPTPKRILRQRYLDKRNNFDKNFKQRKIILPITVRQRLKKNIGLIYSWREQSWQALKEELIFYEEARQNFEYFEAMYF